MKTSLFELVILSFLRTDCVKSTMIDKNTALIFETISVGYGTMYHTRKEYHMPIKYGDRYQVTLLPSSVEEYVSRDNVVRAYDAFVDALDWDNISLDIPNNDMGRPKYDPRAMLKLLIYGYSYCVRSSRKLERACHDNLSFIWLTGGLQPDHKTIAEFRRKNKKLLKEIFKQCVRFCLKCDLIDGNALFLDGAKVRANASIKNSYTKEKCLKTLSNIDERIDELLEECEKIDQREADEGRHGKLKKELSEKQSLRSTVERVMNELNEEDRNSKNIIDPDCSNMRSVQGTHASHNVQAVIDGKNGLIAHIDAVGHGNDSCQFANQITQANETIGKKCEVACADAGYANTDELKKINDQNIKVIVPSRRQALHEKPGPFSNDKFTYDSALNQYTCPAGGILTYRGLNRLKKAKVYHITNANLCRQCPHFGVCTKSHVGRKLARLINEEFKQMLEKQYLEPESQTIYSRRKELAEHPFGHIKRNLKLDAFLMRGREGVLAEISILATCFNVRRVISILGISGILAKQAV
jgi:transposase